MINPFAAVAMGTCGVCRTFFLERETDPLLFFLLQFYPCYVVGVHGHIQAHTSELDSLTCLMIMRMMKKVMMMMMMPVA